MAWEAGVPREKTKVKRKNNICHTLEMDGNLYFTCRSFKLVRIFGRVVLSYIGRGEAPVDRQKRPPGEDGGGAQVTFESFDHIFNTYNF